MSKEGKKNNVVKELEKGELEREYCVKCKKPMAEVPIGGVVGNCYSCINTDCLRFGLLSVVGYKMVKTVKSEVKEVINNAKVRAQDSTKQN